MSFKNVFIFGVLIIMHASMWSMVRAPRANWASYLPKSMQPVSATARPELSAPQATVNPELLKQVSAEAVSSETPVWTTQEMLPVNPDLQRLSRISATGGLRATRQNLFRATTPQSMSPSERLQKIGLSLGNVEAQMNVRLFKQTPQIQNKIRKHPFFKELIAEVQKIFSFAAVHYLQPILDQTTVLKLEIFMYVMDHPQEAEELMNFYQEMKDAQQLITNRLRLLPPDAQKLFNKQVQEYLHSSIAYDRTLPINDMKEKVSRLYPYPDTALRISFWVLMLTISFYTTFNILGYIIHYQYDYQPSESLNLENSEEQELLETFNLLVDALNLPPTNLRKVSSAIADPKVVADFIPVLNCIRLTPLFFKKSLDEQIFVLLHELRHYQQYTQGYCQIIIPQDIIQYAKECNVKPYALNDLNFLSFLNFFRFGFFTSRAMNEFDADLFAARQMKEYPWINTVAIAFDRSRFNPELGYLSSEMISKESRHGKKITLFVYIEKLVHYITQKWNRWIHDLPNENMYLEYIPQHLKEAAVKNKAAKAEAQQLFDLYRAV